MSELRAKVEGHPRIHLEGKDIAVLRERAGGTHALYYGKLLEFADGYAGGRIPREIGLNDNHRVYGDMLPVLAMAYLISEDEKYLKPAKKVMGRIAATKRWGDDLDLVAGHFLAGMSIGYDWLYEHLSRQEREETAGAIAEHAAKLYKYATEQRIWWHDFFLHNWAHVITGGLGYAAAALWGEDEAAERWLEHTEYFFGEVEKALPEDGSYQEGQAYMTYAWESILRYFDMARGLFGRDHWGAKWLAEAPYLVIHSMTPAVRPGDNCMVFGDGPRHCEWHGPVHLFYRSATEYGDAVVQGFAKFLAEKGVGLSRGGCWLNMLWYDAEAPAKGWEHLPTVGYFGNLGTVFARSGWDKDAVHVGFKCTNNAGKKTVREFPGRDMGSGHAHPDAGSVQVYGYGEWLAIDPGYTHYKETANHNTVMVNGRGQLGDERMWFDVMEAYQGREVDVTKVVTTEGYDYMRADVGGIYRSQARVKKFVRHVVFVKPLDILIVDELEGEVKSKFEWLLHADDEIVNVGDEYHVRKNDARMRVVFLAPEGLKARIRRHKVAGGGGHGMDTMVTLTATPEARCKEATFVTMLSVYKGDAPAGAAILAGMEGGIVRVEIRGQRRSREVSLDMGEGRVEVEVSG